MSKKIKIEKENFPEVNIYTRKFDIRYRISSEDRNRYSYWSPIFSISPEVIFERGTREIPGYLTLEKLGSDFVTATWDSVSLYKVVDGEFRNIGELPHYDVWIRWAGSGGATPSDWIYKQRISSTSFNIPIPATYPYTDPITEITTDITPRYLYVEIYRPGRPILRFEETREFPQNSTTVDIDNNAFVFPEGHGSSTGTPGLYLSSTPVGGLTNNTTYYTRTIDFFSIALYATRSEALNDTNRINLSGTPSGTGSFTGYTFRMYDNVITTL